MLQVFGSLNAGCARMSRFVPFSLAAIAVLATPAPAAAQSSDDNQLAIELASGTNRTIFVSGNGVTSLPIFNICLDRVNGKRVILHIADSTADMKGGLTQVVPEGGCLFASGRILYLSAEAASEAPGFENSTALVTVILIPR